jgi:hypothetical protein
MKYTMIFGFIAGALQLIVAGYAFRLNRLFGITRVGWSLFCAFSLLALLYSVQFGIPSKVSAESEVAFEVIDLLVSLLLFTSLIHLEIWLKERFLLECKERQMRNLLESEVEKKTAYLMRAIETLEAEKDERTRLVAELEFLKINRPRLFDCFSEMILEIPAKSIIRVLGRESYMLEVDLANQRTLPPSDVGSILIFSRFVEAVCRRTHLSSSSAIPHVHMVFYRKVIGRLIEAGELPATAKEELENTLFVREEEHEAGQPYRPQICGQVQLQQSIELAYC